MMVLAELGRFFIGLGVFFLGVAALWFVALYSEDKKK